MKNKIIAFLITLCLVVQADIRIVPAASEEISAPSAIVIEQTTGTVLFEKNSLDQRPIASITKIMSLLLIFEALDAGRITPSDLVTVSEHAASMGGSQVFLEPFETQTVEALIKCISIASANDATVAIAEYLAGSEDAFVLRMNERAKELGMTKTSFKNCCGLDEDGHYSCARDVALMSAELLRHEEICNYSTVWMDTIIHKTKKGEQEFGLTNTNKLLKQYTGITGLKTGSTSKAKYCLSASAKRNGVQIIAVVLGAAEPKARFREAAKLLDYGFSICKLYQDASVDQLPATVPVKGGVKSQVQIMRSGSFTYVLTPPQQANEITKRFVLTENLSAPIAIGQVVGSIEYLYQDEIIGTSPVVSMETLEKQSFSNAFYHVLSIYLHRTATEA